MFVASFFYLRLIRTSEVAKRNIPTITGIVDVVSPNAGMLSFVAVVFCLVGFTVILAFLSFVPLLPLFVLFPPSSGVGGVGGVTFSSTVRLTSIVLALFPSASTAFK